MKANPNFLGLPLEFWANVKFLSQEIGYTNSKEDKIKTWDLIDIKKVYRHNRLNVNGIVTNDGKPTVLARQLLEYSKFRSDFLSQAKTYLMNRDEAKALFEKTRDKVGPKCSLPMSQKNEPAFLTGLVNMMIECNVGDLPVDYNPQALTSIVEDGVPVRTLSRRVDGAFPSPLNPRAIWEIKEYYYNKTFGSRIADGVYETQLDGYELTEIRANVKKDIEHYLIIDGYDTWWILGGKSYLCRICDMMHMGTLTECLFGREVVERLPAIVGEWVRNFPDDAIILKSKLEIWNDLTTSVEKKENGTNK